jgi:hypothetical protein
MPGGQPLEELAQPVLTLGQCQWPHVDAVEVKQVEGEQERHAIVLATMEALEVGDTRLIAHHKLAVDRREDRRAGAVSENPPKLEAAWLHLRPRLTVPPRTTPPIEPIVACRW